MKKVLMGILMVLGLTAIVNSTMLYAQEMAAPADVVAGNTAGTEASAKEEDKFSFGKVVSVAEGKIMVKEYDFTKDADVDVSYSVTPETELGNVNAVAELNAGDGIVIDYFEKDGNRVITTLVKEEKTTEAMPEEEAAPAAAQVVPADPAAVVPAAVVPAPEAAPEAPAEQK